MTAHVDDLCIIGTPAFLNDMRAKIEKKYGTVARQQLPMQHVGCMYERLYNGGIKVV